LAYDRVLIDTSPDCAPAALAPHFDCLLDAVVFAARQPRRCCHGLDDLRVIGVQHARPPAGLADPEHLRRWKNGSTTFVRPEVSAHSMSTIGGGDVTITSAGGRSGRLVNHGAIDATGSRGDVLSPDIAELCQAMRLGPECGNTWILDARTSDTPLSIWNAVLMARGRRRRNIIHQHAR
jgi:hypothetical protein